MLDIACLNGQDSMVRKRCLCIEYVKRFPIIIWDLVLSKQELHLLLIKMIERTLSETLSFSCLIFWQFYSHEFCLNRQKMMQQKTSSHGYPPWCYHFQIEHLHETYGVQPTWRVGITSPLHHAVTGQHLSTVELLLTLCHKNGFTGQNCDQLNVSKVAQYLLSKPIKCIDKVIGHLIQCGDKSREIECLLKKENTNSNSAVKVGVGIVIGFGLRGLFSWICICVRVMYFSAEKTFNFLKNGHNIWPISFLKKWQQRSLKVLFQKIKTCNVLHSS